MGRKKKEPIKRICGFCEKEFIVSRNNNYFCCHTCAAFKSALTFEVDALVEPMW